MLAPSPWEQRQNYFIVYHKSHTANSWERFSLTPRGAEVCFVIQVYLGHHCEVPEWLVIQYCPNQDLLVDHAFYTITIVDTAPFSDVTQWPGIATCGLSSSGFILCRKRRGPFRCLEEWPWLQIQSGEKHLFPAHRSAGESPKGARLKHSPLLSIFYLLS